MNSKTRHVNVGRLQFIWWPRHTFCFRRVAAQLGGLYRWIIYVWPIEVRLFAKQIRERA